MGHHYRHIDIAEHRQVMNLLKRQFPLTQIAKIIGVRRGGAIQLQDLNYERGYRPCGRLQQSKLVMLMFAIDRIAH